MPDGHPVIVPTFWAEGRIQKRVHGRQVTVRRWGWSDESQEAAQRHADGRVKVAMERYEAGNAIERREKKVPYNGADGVPIREEILDRRGDAVLTRNCYGAACINTPNVAFIDVDDETALFEFLAQLAFILGVIGTFAVCGISGSWWKGCLLMVTIILAVAVADFIYRFYKTRIAPRSSDRQLRRIVNALKQNPGWRARVYRTPAGHRILLLHRTFTSDDKEFEDFCDLVRADRTYLRMCQRQQCFRARVSPKPWRMGFQTRLRPRGSVWPVKPGYEEFRREWVAEYSKLAEGYASCRFLEEVGDGPTDPVAREIQIWHDELCQAERGLPLA
ncbi:MAG: hypothetical protein ACRC8S_07730 [Fimbriiglobus sp.]